MLFELRTSRNSRETMFFRRRSVKNNKNRSWNLCLLAHELHVEPFLKWYCISYFVDCSFPVCKQREKTDLTILYYSGDDLPTLQTALILHCSCFCTFSFRRYSWATSLTRQQVLSFTRRFNIKINILHRTIWTLCCHSENSLYWFSWRSNRLMELI